MSRVLARKMFKKNAPKRSAKGVGITSMLEDDVAGYAEGGEVDSNDRAKRERMAQDLLDLGRAEFQMFAEGERPQMTRPPATMGMVPQPNPQAAQAAQMQQMAQMGMLPRFQEGGMVETPSIWSRVKDFMWNPPGMDRPPTLAEMRRDMGRSIGIPSLTGTGVSGARTTADPNAMTPALEPARRPLFGIRDSEVPEPPSSGRISDFIWGSTVGLTDRNPATADVPYTPSPEMGSPAGDVGPKISKAGGIMGGRMPEEAPKKEEPKKAPPLPAPAERKSSDLTDIKAERESKAALARQENMWLALMQAGLAIAGGRSPNAITNIGQGGQAGLASFMALEQQRRKDEDAAMRRDLAEREYRLQERRLQAMEPVYAGQAAYYASRPAAAEQMQRMRMAVARQKAEEVAGKSWDNMVKSNPKYMTMSAPALQAQRQLYITQETNRLFPVEYQKILVGLPGTKAESVSSDEE